MYGQVKWYFNGGVATVTKLHEEDYAPNDADIQAVKEAIHKQLDMGDVHLTFTVQDMRVEVQSYLEADAGTILRNAVKVLDENKRIHR